MPAADAKRLGGAKLVLDGRRDCYWCPQGGNPTCPRELAAALGQRKLNRFRAGLGQSDMDKSTLACHSELPAKLLAFSRAGAPLREGALPALGRKDGIQLVLNSEVLRINVKRSCVS